MIKWKGSARKGWKGEGKESIIEVLSRNVLEGLRKTTKPSVRVPGIPAKI
jgi:hypothetical protein